MRLHQPGHIVMVYNGLIPGRAWETLDRAVSQLGSGEKAAMRRRSGGL